MTLARNFRRRRLTGHWRHRKEPALPSAQKSEDDRLTIWVRTHSVVVSDSCYSTTASETSATCSTCRSCVDYDNCAVSADRPGWVMIRVPCDEGKNSTASQEQQHVLPRVPVEEAGETETRPRTIEYRTEEPPCIPGSFPAEAKPAVLPRRYKNWNRKGEVVWVNYYGAS